MLLFYISQVCHQDVFLVFCVLLLLFLLCFLSLWLAFLSFLYQMKQTAAALNMFTPESFIHLKRSARSSSHAMLTFYLFCLTITDQVTRKLGCLSSLQQEGQGCRRCGDAVSGMSLINSDQLL